MIAITGKGGEILLGFLDLFRGGGFEFAEEFFDGVGDVDLEEDEDEGGGFKSCFILK